MSANAWVVDNWVEHAGPQGGIRIRPDAADPLVVDNVIASGFRWGITTASPGGTYRDNRILEITGADQPSCFDGGLGSGTAGAANAWIDNQAPVPSSPIGICGPIP